METILRENTKKREKEFIRTLKDLIVLKEIKSGSFGPNMLVACPSEPNPQIYILKCMKKSKIENQALFQYKLAENTLLKMLLHPFIVEAYRTFQDDTNLYNLVQFIRG